MKTKTLSSLLNKLFKGLTILAAVGILLILLLFVTKNLWLSAISPVFTELSSKNVFINENLNITPIFSAFPFYLLFALQISLYGILFFCLSQLFQSVGRQVVFTKRNLNKIYIIGGCVMGISVLSSILGLYVYSLISQNFSFLSAVTSDLSSLIIDMTPGLLILTIGLFFSQGIKLQEENDLTI